MNSVEFLKKQRQKLVEKDMQLCQLLANVDCKTNVVLYDGETYVKGKCENIYDTAVWADYKICNIKVEDDVLKVYLALPYEEVCYFDEDIKKPYKESRYDDEV